MFIYSFFQRNVKWGAKPYQHYVKCVEKRKRAFLWKMFVWVCVKWSPIKKTYSWLDKKNQFRTVFFAFSVCGTSVLPLSCNPRIDGKPWWIPFLGLREQTKSSMTSYAQVHVKNKPSSFIITVIYRLRKSLFF